MTEKYGNYALALWILLATIGVAALTMAWYTWCPAPSPLAAQLVGDVNGDGKVTIIDVQLVASRWRCRTGDACYVAGWDFDSDGKITVVDIMFVVARARSFKGLKGIVLQDRDHIRDYDLKKLNVAWGYDHWVVESWFGRGLEYCPLIQGRWWGQSFKGKVGPVAARHPGSYWLIFNEPDLVAHDNLTPSQAAVVFKEIQNELLTADPAARLIVGGTSHENPAWLVEFRAAYEGMYGILDVAGYHFHIYPDGMGCIDAQACFNITKDYVIAMKSSLGSGEMWLSEIGLNKSWAGGYMALAVPWLKQNVDRYAWFAAFTYDEPWVYFDYGALLGPTPLGEWYAQY